MPIKKRLTNGIDSFRLEIRCSLKMKNKDEVEFVFFYTQKKDAYKKTRASLDILKIYIFSLFLVVFVSPIPIDVRICLLDKNTVSSLSW